MRERVLLAHRLTVEEPESWGVEASAALSVAQFKRRLERERSRGETLRLTLDDGYAEGVEDVVVDLDVPCEIFLCTGFLDGTARSFEWELSGLLKQRRSREGADRFGLAGETGKWSVGEWYGRLRLPLRKSGVEARRSWLSRFQEKNGLATPEMPPFLTWEAVRRLSGHPLIRFGAHTVTHPYLPAISAGEVWREFRGSKRRIQDATGMAVDGLAYPYGASRARCRALARLAGYRRGFTTRPGFRERELSLRIGRYDMNEA